MKVAVCYLTNINKNFEISSFIKNQLIDNVIVNKDNKNKYDLFVLLNNNKKTKVKNSNIYTFTWPELREKYNHQNRFFIKEFMGVCHLPLFYLYDEHPEYDYYLFYEDDLYFTGFNDEINPFENVNFWNNDITFTYNRKYNRYWFWVYNYEYNLPNSWLGYEGLLNCYIISNKTLKDLKEFCCDGKWFGHHELMVNSFFMNQQNKYKINHINNTYPIRIYWLENELIDSLKFKDLDKNSFVHPIKNKDMLTKVKSI